MTGWLQVLSHQTFHQERFLNSPRVVVKDPKAAAKWKIYQEIRTGWWFQPLWKILVKLDHLPQIGMKIKNIWNHHLGVYLKMVVSNRNLLFQGSIFRSYVSFRECIESISSALGDWGKPKNFRSVAPLVGNSLGSQLLLLHLNFTAYEIYHRGQTAHKSCHDKTSTYLLTVHNYTWNLHCIHLYPFQAPAYSEMRSDISPAGTSCTRPQIPTSGERWTLTLEILQLDVAANILDLLTIPIRFMGLVYSPTFGINLW